MATRWCLICGGEYIDTVDECPDCEVPLVDERPDQDLSDLGAGQVVYDLAEWAAESRVMLEQLLESEGVRRAWEGTTLVVPDVFEVRVDNLVEHVEVTTLPTLEPDAERVAYDVSDWTDDMVHELQRILDRGHVPYEFDAEGDIVTLSEHQERVESLMDAIELADEEPRAPGRVADADTSQVNSGDGHAPADDEAEDEGDGDDVGDTGDDAGTEQIDSSVVLSDLFVSTDRMMKSARDHRGVLTFASAADRVERMGTPYGFSRVAWQDICNQVSSIRALLEADDASDEDIQNGARDLRNTLREYV
ncbi:MAG: hypothetical protein HYX32_14310 [Actinobacteria bacterium]|nr:hypothetical protein [Actinomycetota bacterium]